MSHVYQSLINGMKQITSISYSHHHAYRALVLIPHPQDIGSSDLATGKSALHEYMNMNIPVYFMTTIATLKVVGSNTRSGPVDNWWSVMQGNYSLALYISVKGVGLSCTQLQ